MKLFTEINKILLQNIKPSQYYKNTKNPRLFFSDIKHKCKTKSIYDISLNHLFCEECGLQQSNKDNLNYFEIFGQPLKWDIDQDILQKRYKHIQMNIHPDKFQQSTQQQQERSSELVRYINQSYETLQHPLHRGKYLLSILEPNIKSPDILHQDNFLQNIFIIQERIDDADINTLKSIRDENNISIKSKLSDLNTAFKQNDFNKVIILLDHLTYLYTISKDLDERIPLV